MSEQLKYELFKVFEYKLIPEDISIGYNPGRGCTIQITVNSESLYPEVKEISKWLLKHGAAEKEKIFIFND